MCKVQEMSRKSLGVIAVFLFTNLKGFQPEAANLYGAQRNKPLRFQPNQKPSFKILTVGSARSFLSYR